MPNPRRNENSYGISKFGEILIDNLSQRKEVIEDKVYRYLKMWLQNPVFLDEAINKNIRITFLQVVYLVVELEGSMAKFKDEEVPLQFIQRALLRIADEPHPSDVSQICENKLILMIVHNMIKMSNKD